MNLVVDTSIWSLILRRPHVEKDSPFVRAFRLHVNQEDGLFVIGNILQELFDGVKNRQAFESLVKILAPFPLLELTRSTYILASELRNTCRSKGIQAGPIDFLIAAACLDHGFPLLTADRDFTYIAKHSDLMVFPLS